MLHLLSCGYIRSKSVRQNSSLSRVAQWSTRLTLTEMHHSVVGSKLTVVTETQKNGVCVCRKPVFLIAVEVG